MMWRMKNVAVSDKNTMTSIAPDLDWKNVGNTHEKKNLNTTCNGADRNGSRENESSENK